jgi:hypothetical protein
MIPSVATVAVSMIYCLWDAYRRINPQPRHRLLRERVAYMLWVMAGQLD